MLTSIRKSPALYLSILVILVFIGGRLWGGALFDNNWSFDHWQHLPTWYLVLWFVLLTLMTLLFASLGERMALFFNSRLKVIIAVAVLFGLVVLFQFDSFLYGGGNLRVAQVAQTDSVICRWFEYGSVFMVGWLTSFIDLFDLHYNTAGVYAWKLFSFGCTLLSLIAALKLAKELAEEAVVRFYLFLVLFFGPQTILYFGFVGVEPVVVAASMWFTLAAVKLLNRYTGGHLLILWAVLVVGVIMHHTLLYLLPAAVYVTVRGRQKHGRGERFALMAGFVTYLVLLGLTYYWGEHNLEFSRFILFLSGKLPHLDYGVFSARHIGDILQTFFLAFPQIVVVVYLVLTHRHSSGNKGGLPLLVLLSLSGLTMVMILDPRHNIVMDFPRLTAYLFPLSLTLAMLLKEQRDRGGKRLFAILAAISIVLPLSYLPSYLRIAKADPYVTDYLEKHNSFYMAGCLAFRDAYFYRKEMDQANGWEWKLPNKSPDYLNLEGIKDLALNGEEAEALRTLYKVIAHNPYWTEARVVFVSIQMNLRNYALAKPQIDTCLMLDPYKKKHLLNLYRYYRDIQDYPLALTTIRKTLGLFPDDNDVKTDLMIVYYRSGGLMSADSLADNLLTVDSTLPYPYLIKGFLAERRKDTVSAISSFEKFISLAPNEPDTPAIMEHLNELKWGVEGE